MLMMFDCAGATMRMRSARLLMLKPQKISRKQNGKKTVNLQFTIIIFTQVIS